MVNLQAKGKKEPAYTAQVHAAHMRATGYTVFRFDLAPKFTKANFSLGDACRELMRLSGYKVTFWRCEVRGLAVHIRTAPTSTYLHDQGESWKVLHFSTNEDEEAAKRELILDLILDGMADYRALPNAAYTQQIVVLKSLLTAPASATKEDWLAARAQLHPRIARVLATHEADLRKHLLGRR